ncbi:MAG: hypothetical protein F4X40_05355 [Chloroflexi bacterium]|nr:hypothetical protein [Chloroflexota bacterium]
MPNDVTISLTPEGLDSGSPEERATFGLLALTANDRLLTQGVETDNDVVRHGPYVPGYPLAEWFVWNWWRIRWEAGPPMEANAASRWAFAHQMQTVGDGYVWPNITIYSDGTNAFVHSRQSLNPKAVLFRYLGTDHREEVSASSLEEAVDEFVRDVLVRLESNGLHKTNLHRVWKDLATERAEPELTRYRKLEAQLGYDPDEADEDALRRRLSDAAILGEEAMGELAADAILEKDPLSSMSWSKDISEAADQRGFDADLNSGLRLSNASGVAQAGPVEAWRLGRLLAHKVRAQENLDGDRVSNERLAQYAGTGAAVISATGRRSRNISFALDQCDGHGRISLRSKWVTGRRFELARLIGDRLARTQVTKASENLYPATRSFSYRQKMQRAFAAELLSPFNAVDEMLDGDYSEEKQNEIATHFKVSAMTIQAQLVNHGRLRLEDAPDIYGRGAAFSTPHAV